MLDSIIPKFQYKPWQEFRDQELWTTRVDKLLKENKDTLVKLHGMMFPKYEADGIKNCLKMLMDNPLIAMSDKEARFCYGMSKMTVKDEVNNHEEYDKLRFVEFLEYLGRVAHAKYIDMYGQLHEKLELLLENVFMFYGFKFKKPKVVLDDVASSDESISERDGEEQEYMVETLDSNRGYN